MTVTITTTMTIIMTIAMNTRYFNHRAITEKESLESRVQELKALIGGMEGAARAQSQRTNR